MTQMIHPTRTRLLEGFQRKSVLKGASTDTARCWCGPAFQLVGTGAGAGLVCAERLASVLCCSLHCFWKPAVQLCRNKSPEKVKS